MIKITFLENTQMAYQPEGDKETVVVILWKSNKRKHRGGKKKRDVKGKK